MPASSQPKNAPLSKEDIHRASAKERKLLGQLGLAVSANDPKEIVKRQQMYFRSYMARLAATVKADRATKKHKKIKAGEHKNIASALRLFEPSAEPVRVHLKPKDNVGNYRTIMDFGVANYARQIMVRKVMDQQFSPLPCQFTVSNGGMRAALLRIKELLDEGHHWAVHIDVRDCFGSYKHEALLEVLPLPREVIKNNISSKYLPLVPGNICQMTGPTLSHDDYLEKVALIEGGLVDARRGIPPGSAASGVVNEFLMSLALCKLPDTSGVVQYTDDFLVLAASKTEAVEFGKALRGVLGTHPVGQLWPVVKGEFEKGERIRFLGHDIHCGSNGVEFNPKPEKLLEHTEIFEHGIEKLNSGELTPERQKTFAESLRRKLAGFNGAYSLWDGCADYCEAYKAAIKAFVENSTKSSGPVGSL